MTTGTTAGTTKLNLRSVRCTRGVSLSSIAELTKIGTMYLEAIESERFDRLPGQIYTVSYIRQYARAIGYDEDRILRLYMGGA